VAIQWRIFTRKAHRWGAIIVALPFLLVILSGLLLQVKKNCAWIQPPTMRGEGKIPKISFDVILQTAKEVPEAEIQSWGDIERLDIQPNRGMVKVICKNRWELQIDLQSGALLQSAYRRSDLIESLHDGSFFSDSTKLWVFLPVAFVVLGLWVSGIYLYFLPIAVRWSRRKAKKEAGK
jgi:uncharacterized iron-regulated membrane protein